MHWKPWEIISPQNQWCNQSSQIIILNSYWFFMLSFFISLLSLSNFQSLRDTADKQIQPALYLFNNLQKLHSLENIRKLICSCSLHHDWSCLHLHTQSPDLKVLSCLFLHRKCPLENTKVAFTNSAHSFVRKKLYTRGYK